jgi:hypothetical protein
MAQRAEAFPLDPYQEETRGRKAVIIPFPSPKKEKGSTEKETGQGYEQYKTLGGKLSPDEYRDVLKSAAEGKNVPYTSLRSRRANVMARTAEITLSPEVLGIYGILRDKQPDPPDPKKNTPSEITPSEINDSDQKLLAEALRIVGDKRSLAVFTEKFSHMFERKDL